DATTLSTFFANVVDCDHGEANQSGIKRSIRRCGGTRAPGRRASSYGLQASGWSPEPGTGSLTPPSIVTKKRHSLTGRGLTVRPLERIMADTLPQIGNGGEVPAAAEPAVDLEHPSLYLNRELSWLAFNERV